MSDNLCFSHHGDWTGPHRRQPSCPPAKWFVNEEGNVYDYAPELQAEHFPNDFRRPFDTQDEAEQVAAELAKTAPGPIEAEIRRRLDEGDHETDPDPAGGGVPQMSYDEAISYAIFAINTLMEPSASSDEDCARLELHSDEIIAALVDIRETVRG